VNSFWQTVASLLEKGQNVFLTLVAEHTQHSPGTTGAKLLVAKNRDPEGTIGGGIMEYNLVKRARGILKRGNFIPEIQTLIHRKSGPGEKSGMICAGTQTNLYYLCRPEKDGDTAERIVHLVEYDQSATLTIDSSGMHVREHQPDIHQPQFKLSDGENGWLYEEQLLNFKRIAIIGGGHCSLALSRVMKHLGYEVFVFDTRETVFTVRENIYARTVCIVKDFHEAGPIIQHPELTHVVVMTTNVDTDVQGLLGVINLPFPFIGVMGSQAKIVEILRRLKSEEISEDQLSRLTAPVGIPMGSNTPDEIAISVAAAQILQDRVKTTH